MRKRAGKIIIFVLIVGGLFALFGVSLTPIKQVLALPDNINLEYESLENLEKDKPFGKLINLSFSKAIQTDSQSDSSLSVNFKLFNLFSIRTITVNTECTKIYAGGNIVGFSLNSSGIIVVGNSAVTTENGPVDTLQNSDIKNGDIILEIENDKVNRISDLSSIINKDENQGKELTILIKRKGETLERKITPAKDSQSGKYKLGLWVKDDASGVGTLTYVREDNARFGALGHAISDPDTKQAFELNSGDMYKSTVIGINKGQKGKPGELKALFIQGSNNIGTVDKNTRFGVFGSYKQSYLEKLSKDDLISIGGRFTAKPGKAKIRTSLDGEVTKEYDIEIIKTNYQNASSDKSMVFRVTDKELLRKTGGIVQGMSGSPIIQNGKMVGAVTHVFVSDPTKGFGIYLDWMINE